MAFDGITIAAMVKELHLNLDGGRFNKIAQPEADELLITGKGANGQCRLLLSASASLPLIYFTSKNKPSPMTAPNFCMLLRKHIGSARVSDIRQPGMERVVMFELEHLNELGDPCKKVLIMELMGKHSNIIFCDDKGMILDSIKHVSSHMSSVREVLPGREYFIPKTQDKLDPLTVSEEEFCDVVCRKPCNVSRAVYSSLTGISPVVAEEICFRASIDGSDAAQSLDEAARVHLYHTFRRLMDQVVEGDFSPDTYIYPEHEVFGRTESRHATMIRRVDDVLKDMIQLLKDLGIDDNTMIVFTSDNGPHNEPGSGNYGNGAQDPAYFMSYGMMDGIKRDCWEGGMRVPAVVRWPGVVPSGISLNASQFQDWMATFADVAGVPVPSRCDGVSLLPTLAGVPERQKTGVIYAEYAYSGSTPNYSDFLQQHRGRGRQQQQIIFVDGFKGIRMGNAAPTTDFEIYDTEKDPQEAANLAASRPDLQEKMKAQALRSRRSSPIASTSFDAGYIAPVSAPAGLREGRLRWRAWNRSFDWVPDFRQLEEGPCSTGATDVSDVLSVKAGLSGQKGVELTGYLRVPVTGEYQFYLQTDSNEGSRAFVHLHDMQLIDADYAYTPGTQAASNAREGVSGDVQPNAVQTVKLTAGLHPIRIGYVGKAASSSLSLQWEGPETSGREPIPASAFSYEYVNPFNLEKTEETVGCAASGTGLTVQTHLPWTVSCDQPWVTVSPVSGSGTSVLDIAVEANGLQTEREAVVTVVCGGEQRTFTLRQEAAPAPAGYDKWKQDHFADGTPDEQMAPDACPAGDGISNLMKYATGMDPNQPCGSVTKLAVREEAGGKYLVLSWSVNPEATDVTFHVESSSDLEEWADEGAVTPDGACGEFRDTVALGKGSPERRFLRLKVTR